MKLTRAEWGALGVALAVRIAALWSLEQTAYAEHPLVDAHTYWQQAQQLLSGDDPFASGLYQPPGYPAFLAALGTLLGGELSLAVVRRAHLVLGMLTTAGLLALGRLWAPWAGAVAALLFSLHPTTLLFEGDLLTPALTGAALVGALLCVRGPRWWQAPFGGALMGLATVCHPTYLLAAAWLGAWRAAMPDGRRAAAGFFVALGLSLAPTTLRNHQDFGTVTLVSHNAGLNFFLGNNPGWRETAFLRAGLPFRKLVLEAEPHRRDAAARDAYWKTRAWTEITDHPDAWAATVATKAYWSIHSTEIPRNEDYRCRVETPPLGWLGWLPARYGWVFPLAVLGAAGAVRRRDRAGIALTGSWVALHVPMILFLVADRYRLASWPIMCLLAPLGARTLWRLVQARSPWLLAVAGLAALPWMPIDPVTQKDPAWCLHTQGNLTYMDGDHDKAMDLYAQSIALDPGNLSARTYLASALMKQREYREAEDQMRAVLQAFPDHFPSLKLMSSIQKQRGNTSAAADYMGRAYRVPGDRRRTGVSYVRLLVEAGRMQEARDVVAQDPQLQRDRRVREALGGR